MREKKRGESLREKVGVGGRVEEKKDGGERVRGERKREG